MTMPPVQSMKVLPLVVACLVAGCAAPGGPLQGVQEAVADVLLPPPQEDQLGDRMAREIESQQAIHPDAALQRRVSTIGERLLAHSGAPGMPYDFSFKVTLDPEVNAFALPGGHIYVTSGMVDMADTDAQLAAVIAHEIAHVTERHIAERLATSHGLDALSAAALGRDAGTVTQLVGSLLRQGFLLKYSREQELQADRVGLRYLHKAGYDRHAAIQIFRKLAAEDGAGPQFLSSHPATKQRIEQLEQIIAREA